MSGLRLTNGTVTVTLHDPSVGLYAQRAYVPHAPELGVTETTDMLMDGGEIPVTAYKNVTETASIFLSGGLAAIRTTIQQMNALFESARTWQRRRMGSRLWVEFRADDAETWYRSEILNGRVEMDDSSMGGPWVPSGRVIVDITWTRRYFWEGAESFLTLTNAHGTGTTVTVYNSNDANYDHFVAVSSVITGDIPAPCRIEYTNTYNVAARMTDVYIGHQAYRNVSGDDLVFKANAADFFTPFSQDTSLLLSDYTAGSGREWSWAYSGEIDLGYWSLPSAILTAAQGGYFRVLLRTGVNVGTFALRMTIKISNLSVLWSSGWVNKDSSRIQSLISLPLPPFRAGMTVAQTSLLTLGIQARSSSATSKTFRFDSLYLMPTESYRSLLAQGYGAAFGVRVMDDQMANSLYSDGWAGGAMGNYTDSGSQIMLVPGQTNRLYFVAGNTANTGEPIRTSSVRVAFRPRRLTL